MVSKKQREGLASAIDGGLSRDQIQQRFNSLRRRNFAKWAAFGVGCFLVGVAATNYLSGNVEEPIRSHRLAEPRYQEPNRTPTQPTVDASDTFHSASDVSTDVSSVVDRLPPVKIEQKPVTSDEATKQIASAPIIMPGAFKWRVDLGKKYGKEQPFEINGHSIQIARYEVSTNEFSTNTHVDESDGGYDTTLKHERITTHRLWRTVDKETGEENPGTYRKPGKVRVDEYVVDVSADSKIKCPDPESFLVPREGSSKKSRYLSIVERCQADAEPTERLLARQPESKCSTIKIVTNSGAIKAVQNNALIWSLDTNLGSMLPEEFYPSGWSTKEEQNLRFALFRIPNTSNLIIRASTTVTGVDLDTGKIIWQNVCNYDHTKLFLIPGTANIVVREPGSISVIEASSGKKLWAYQWTNEVNPPVATDRRDPVQAGPTNEVDPFGVISFAQGNVVLSISIPNNNLPVKTATDYLYLGLDPETRQVKWKFWMSQLVKGNNPHIFRYEPNVLYLASDSELVAYRLPSSSPTSEPD